MDAHKNTHTHMCIQAHNGCHAGLPAVPATTTATLYIIIIYIHGLGFNFCAAQLHVERGVPGWQQRRGRPGNKVYLVLNWN